MGDLEDVKRALAKVATSWRVHRYGAEVLDENDDTVANCCFKGTRVSGGTEQEFDNAALIANAPTWLAALCDEVERMRGQIELHRVHRNGLDHRLDLARSEVARLRRIIAMLGHQPSHAGNFECVCGVDPCPYIDAALAPEAL